MIVSVAEVAALGNHCPKFHSKCESVPEIEGSANQFLRTYQASHAIS
jgi:hypothetical protein